MSELVLVDEQTQEERRQVVELMMHGKSEYAVARKLGIKVIAAKNYWREYQTLIRQDHESTDLAKEYLDRMVKHYDDLIDKSYDILNDLNALAFTHNVAGQQNATLKNISDYERLRVDALQKAGLLEGAELGDELAMREEREQQLLDILRNHLCDDCKVEVRDRLSALTNVVEGSVVDG